MQSRRRRQTNPFPSSPRNFDAPRYRVSNTSAPLNRSVNVRSNVGYTHRISGEAIVLSSFNSNAGVLDLHPSHVPWLTDIAKLFDFYKWRAVSLQFLSSTPTTQPGSIAFAFDYDSADGNPPDIGGMLGMSTSSGFQLQAIWKDSGLIKPNMALLTDRWFATVPYEKQPSSQADFRESIPARFKWFTDATTNQNMGNILIRYTVEFKGRKAIPGPPNLREVSLSSLPSEGDEISLPEII
jgi:hypothetical protein